MLEFTRALAFCEEVERELPSVDVEAACPRGVAEPSGAWERARIRDEVHPRGVRGRWIELGVTVLEQGVGIAIVVVSSDFGPALQDVAAAVADRAEAHHLASIVMVVGPAYVDSRIGAPIADADLIALSSGNGWSHGTLGGFFRHTSSSSIVAMSNAHIIATGMAPTVGQSVFEVAPRSQPVRIGGLLDFVPLTADNLMDAAIATLDNPDPKMLTAPTSAHAPLSSTPQMAVTRVGAVSTCTGRVRALLPGVTIQYQLGRAAPVFRRFRRVLLIEPDAGYPRFSRPGDSGSIVWESRSWKPAGLHFAATQFGYGYAVPIGRVLRRMGVRPI